MYLLTNACRKSAVFFLLTTCNLEKFWHKLPFLFCPKSGQKGVLYRRIPYLPLRFFPFLENYQTFLVENLAVTLKNPILDFTIYKQI